jgi:hypothetical protein
MKSARKSHLLIIVFNNLLKPIDRKWVPYKIESNMIFQPRVVLVVSDLLIVSLLFFVMSIYVSEFRVVISVTIPAIKNEQSR